jgi:hypothetical protein
MEINSILSNVFNDLRSTTPRSGGLIKHGKIVYLKIFETELKIMFYERFSLTITRGEIYRKMV